MTDDKKPAKSELAFGDEKIHWDQDMSYGDYLKLTDILNAQHPLTDEHDEMLFIIIHQASELWMKLCLHEISSATRDIKANDLSPAFKKLSRVARIQGQLKQSWEVLATMTPFDYEKFRPALGKSSGFQSFQYRGLEFSLGHKDEKFLELYKNAPENHKFLKTLLETPGLYDQALQLLARRGFDIPADRLDRDWRQDYAASTGVEEAWLRVYKDVEKYWELYELAEKLVDIEYHFQQWRFAHMKTVERIIGFKRGTGGSSGVHYLSKALSHSFFPELWSVRTRM
ncbi:MAG: tryptophan 2,3-dioxygenase [Sphingomonadales bacterium]